MDFLAAAKTAVAALPEPADQAVTVTETTTVPEAPSDSTPEGTSGEDQVEDEDAETTDEVEVPGEQADEEIEEETPDTDIRVLADDEEVMYNGQKYKVEDLVAMKSVMTKATQEAAEVRKDAEARVEEVNKVISDLNVWWEEKSQAPAAFATEILAATKSPTDALAEAIIQLNNLGKLDPEFAKLFNLTAPDGAIAKAAGSNATEARLAQLEREEQARKEAQETAQLHDRWAAEIESQIQEVVVANGLSFATPQDAAKFRSDLINTAAERGTETIAIAYELMEAARLKAAALEAKKTQKVNSKRAMRVVSKPTDAPSGSSGTKVTDWRSASRIAVDAAL